METGGKRCSESLCEMEATLLRDLVDGINSYKAINTTLNAYYDEYIETKHELKQSIFVTMQEQSIPPMSPILTLSVPASLVNLFRQPDTASDSLIQEALFFMKSSEWLKPGDLLIFCSKTSLGYSITKGGKLSELSSPRFMSWGILLNGVCLTARISESRNKEKGYTLSDILIADCPEKYFLSPKAMEHLLSNLYPEDRGNESTAQKEQAHV